MSSALLRGFLLGFAIALMPGPMFFLCLRRTLSAGWRAGLATGLGIATADGVYAALAAGGVGALAALLAGSQRWITLAGGAALVVLGLRSLRQRTAIAAATPAAGSAYGSAAALTLANPATVVSFAPLFAAVGVHAPLVVPAVVLGSLSWWLVLVSAAAVLRAGTGERTSRVLALLAGCALIAFGVVAVGSAALR